MIVNILVSKSIMTILFGSEIFYSVVFHYACSFFFLKVLYGITVKTAK